VLELSRNEVDSGVTVAAQEAGTGGGRSEPIRVHAPKIPVPVGSTGVAGTVQVGYSTRVRLVGRVIVQASRGLVLDEDLTGAAFGVGVKSHRIHATGNVVPAGGVGGVVLKLQRGRVDLVEEAVVQGVAHGGVGAPVPRGAAIHA